MIGDTALGLAALLLLAGALAAAALFVLGDARHPGGWRGVAALVVYTLAVLAEHYGAPLALALWVERTAGRQIGGHAWPHDAGDTLEMVLGWQSALLAWGPLQAAGGLAIAAGAVLLLAARRRVAAAHRERRLAVDGPYARLRHPEYAAGALVALGALLLWPGWIGLALLPALAWVHLRLARAEDALLLAEHGDAWRRYAADVPAFVPRMRR